MWWLWILIAVVAAIGEMMTTGLFLAPVAVAAVIAAVVAVFLPGLIQLAAFAALSLAGIVVFRPLVVHALGMDLNHQIGSPVTQSHLVGRRAIVTREVDSSGGQIRIGEGEFWTARSYSPGETIPPGQRVEILLVDGLTALVAPVQTTPALESAPTGADEKGRE
jgi:membrane protein implicated in regulation of membrane protease activity